MPKHSRQNGKCIKTVHDSKPKVEENGKKAVFLNPGNEEIKIVQVDGCLVTGATLRADFIVAKPTIVDVIVELKGKDIYRACDQITATLEVWRSNEPFSARIAGLIICSRSPASSTELQLMKVQARKRGIALVVEESGRREYNFEAFE